MNTTNASSSTTANEWLLPFNRGFVIQVEAHAEVTANSLRGRVEHMASGRAAHFHSLAELLGFLEWNLKDGISGIRQEPLAPSDTEDRQQR